MDASLRWQDVQIKDWKLPTRHPSESWGLWMPAYAGKTFKLKAGNYPHVTPAQAGVYGYQPALVRQ